MKKFILKNIFLSLIFAATAYSAIAQKMKVTYDDDTIKVNGAPHALMYKKSAGALIYDFSIRTMSGTELIFIKALLRDTYGRAPSFAYGKNQEVYHEINFIGSGGKAELQHQSAKGFAKLVVENNLIKDNAVDAEAEKRFMQVYHGNYPETNSAPQNYSPVVNVNINNNSTPPPPAEAAPPPLPKSKSPVTLNGNEIIRDNGIIGKFRQDTTSSTYSMKQIFITIYSESGDKAAEATAPLASPKEWSIKTFSDGKSFNILYDAPGEREKLFRYLADKNYLAP